MGDRPHGTRGRVPACPRRRHSDGARLRRRRTRHGTNPLVFDTDGDGFGDGIEIAAGTDSLNPASFPPSVPLSVPLGLVALAALLIASGARRARGRA
ncbi:MAG TPA: hypothetical protein VMW19_18385 [Myxococcota bacterium]|nr:hypothetical protein [Myxococcota bacterium]